MTETIAEVIGAIFLVLGSIFMLIGNIGLVRLPDLYMRLHAPTTASTLGLGCFLLAAISYAILHHSFGIAELLIAVLAFITAPVSANLLAQAALHLKLRSQSGDVPEAINRPLPWQNYRRFKK